jgi:hypothetical protein
MVDILTPGLEGVGWRKVNAGWEEGDSDRVAELGISAGRAWLLV